MGEELSLAGARLIDVTRRLVLATLVVTTSCHGPQARTPAHRSVALELGRKPRTVSSDLFLCPGGFPFAAYGRVFYLPNDPGGPDASVRPARCFSTSDDARRAGYRLAPAPPGGETIGDVSLVPPNPSAIPICRRAARSLGLPILCPTLAPLPFGPITECRRPDCVEEGAFVLQDYFAGPPGYVGIPGQDGNHLFLLEAKSGREGQVEFLTCDQPKTQGMATVRGRRARWIDCPESSTMNSGHVMLVWTEGATRCAVSLHADTGLNRSIALAVAQHLEAVTGRRKVSWLDRLPVAPRPRASRA